MSRFRAGAVDEVRRRGVAPDVTELEPDAQPRGPWPAHARRDVLALEGEGNEVPNDPGVGRRADRLAQEPKRPASQPSTAEERAPEAGKVGGVGDHTARRRADPLDAVGAGDVLPSTVADAPQRRCSAGPAGVTATVGACARRSRSHLRDRLPPPARAARGPPRVLDERGVPPAVGEQPAAPGPATCRARAGSAIWARRRGGPRRRSRMSSGAVTGRGRAGSQGSCVAPPRGPAGGAQRERAERSSTAASTA
jgi:hypothetical protein